MLMNWNGLFFMGFSYMAIFLFLVGLIYRYRQHPFTISSMSSELLEKRKLYWGSVAFHWSIILILLAHLANILFPDFMVSFEETWPGFIVSHTLGVATGTIAIFGLAVLIWRRAVEPRVRSMTTVMDVIVLAILLIQVVLGMSVRIGLFNEYAKWFPEYFVPFFISLGKFNPQPELIGGLPWLAQAHVFSFFVLLAILPFSRLIHLLTLPIGYLFRPWQIVIGMRRGQI
jgi:nitrate reductase gamma subunit